MSTQRVQVISQGVLGPQGPRGGFEDAATKEYIDTTVASAVANTVQGITRAEYLDPQFVPTPGVLYVITGE